MRIQVDLDTAATYAEFTKAREARARWEAREKELREKLLKEADYVKGDKFSTTAVTPSGVPLYVVKVYPRRDLDVNYVKKHHPQVYAEAERVSYVATVREAERGDRDPQT